MAVLLRTWYSIQPLEAFSQLIPRSPAPPGIRAMTSSLLHRPIATGSICGLGFIRIQSRDIGNDKFPAAQPRFRTEPRRSKRRARSSHQSKWCVLRNSSHHPALAICFGSRNTGGLRRSVACGRNSGAAESTRHQRWRYSRHRYSHFECTSRLSNREAGSRSWRVRGFRRHSRQPLPNGSA
jgi:hypothetical protein